MKVLVVGGGGREHAIVQSVRRSRHTPEVLCAPGNGGTAAIAENVDVAADDLDGLVSLARDRQIDLTIVGPEAPLCAGIVDRFEDASLRAFGPNAAAARLEGDKAYTKQLLNESGIPTAFGKHFERFEDAKAFIASRDSAVVVKAAGLAAGKGVSVCDEPSDAILVAEKMMVDGLFGDAGRHVVIEEKLTGQELSVHAIFDGSNICILATSQDHKCVGEGDTGPNTGGMGAYSPAPVATDSVMRVIETDVLVPVAAALRRRDIDYRGVLYCGIMVTPGGPKVLEFNCRFGDPETQVILPRLRTDFVDLANACIDGTLDRIDLSWDPRVAVCVVIASRGYPSKYSTGLTITGATDDYGSDVSVFHAGTKLIDTHLITSGGRVIGVTAMGDDVRQARDLAYGVVDRIEFDGAFSRRDIAHRALREAAGPLQA